jgi:hypothetical protein
VGFLIGFRNHGSQILNGELAGIEQPVHPVRNGAGHGFHRLLGLADSPRFAPSVEDCDGRIVRL